MATSKIPSLSTPRNIGHGRKSSFSMPMAFALPKIVEQRGCMDEDTDTSGQPPEKNPNPGGDGNQVRTSRNVNIQRTTIAPIIQKIKLDSVANNKMKCKSRPRTRLGQDRLETQQTRPSTSTPAWPNPDCKLSLKISAIPTCPSKKSSPHLPSSKNYQNDNFPSLIAEGKSVIPEKSEITDLCIGIQETWKVDSSEAPKKLRHNSLHGNHMIGSRAKQNSVPKTTMSFSPFHSAGFRTDNMASRTSSRMGRNSLDQFLQNVKCSSDLACVKPKLISDKVVKRTETTQIALSPKNSHKNQILHLKGLVRDPIHYHRVEGLSNFQADTTTTSANKTDRMWTNSRQSVNRRSLVPPLNPHKVQDQGDVPSLLASNILDGAYHVFNYIVL